MPETNPGVGKGFEVQLKVEDINKEPPITPAMVKAAFSLGKSRYACIGSSGPPSRRAIILEQNW